MSWQGFAAAGQGYGYSYSAASSSSTSVTKKLGQQPQGRQSNREQHMAKVEIWLCTICNKDFGTKSGLNRHYTMVHEQPKPKAIRDVPSVQKAMVQYRANSPSIVCRICGNSFASPSNLTRHMNTVHQPGPARPGPGPGASAPRNTAVSQSTKVVQKNKTNVTVNMYNPVFYNNCNRY